MVIKLGAMKPIRVNFLISNLLLITINWPPAHAETKTCSSGPLKFKSKSLQFGFRDSNSLVQIELVDLCHMTTNGFRLTSQYDYVDQQVRIGDDFITFFHHSFSKFDIQIEKVLGKGNYGSVFLARSKHYGKIAMKIATNQDSAFYDPVSKRECCFGHHSGMPCNPCQRRLNELIPFEVATGLLTMDAQGVVKSKAFGVISSNRRLLFYVVLMEYLDNSMTLLSFVQKCFRRFSQKTRLEYISETQRKLNEINKSLIRNQKIFHNDLKSDNILVKLKSGDKCGGGKAKLDVYLIDFGNAILNVNRRGQNGEAVLVQSQFKYKKYFLMYRAPEITCQLEHASMPQMLAWYLGVIALEMCSNGVGNIPVGPSPNVCQLIRMRQAQGRNSFDSMVVSRPGAQYSFRLCFERNVAGYLKRALSIDPSTRISSDNLVKTKLV